MQPHVCLREPAHQQNQKKREKKTQNTHTRTTTHPPTHTHTHTHRHTWCLTVRPTLALYQKAGADMFIYYDFETVDIAAGRVTNSGRVVVQVVEACKLTSLIYYYI